ncbi:MAG TPA: hypothetical protein VFV87_09060 [Pirellulaceae bacterium]|nr:hypothetical protein [Pirellulaceae bacterium]
MADELDTWLLSYKTAEKLSNPDSNFDAQASSAGAWRKKTLKKIAPPAPARR